MNSLKTLLIRIHWSDFLFTFRLYFLFSAKIAHTSEYPCPSLFHSITNIREFKKLRRQLQRKRHIKIELCVKFSLLRLLHVDHVVQNTRSALSLAWYERFSCKGKE